MSGGLLLLLALAALLAAANGANDAGKPVATLAGSGMTSYRRALTWGACTTTAGALVSSVVAAGLAGTFAAGFLVTDPGGGAPEAAAGAIAATTWVCLATWRGGPVSTTHAIAGGLIGAGIASGGAGMVRWGVLVPKVLVPLAVSPVAAAALGAALLPLVRRSAGRWRGTCFCAGVAHRRLAMLIPLGSSSQEVSPFPAAPFARVGTDPETCAPARTLSLSVRPENLHWLSAGTTSFARGLNDAPKIAALTMPLLLSGEGWRALSFCVVAIGMGVGSIVGGSRIARVLGERISRIEGQGGLGANLATSILVLGASPLGLPVSTTHVATGAITGTGLSAGTGAVSWEVLKGIVLAWIVTLPVSALLGAGAMMLLGTAR